MAKSYNRLPALILLIFLISGRAFFFWRRPPAAVTWRRGRNFCLTEKPESRFGRQRARLGEAIVYFPRKTKLKPGDCLAVRGILQKTKGGWEQIKNPKITVLKSPPLRLKLQTAASLRLLSFRQRLTAIYQRYLPQPEASLLTGIVLGAKSQLPAGFYQSLQKTGTLHIVVASGYNLTVISQQPVELLSWWFGRRLSLFLGGGLIWLYVALAGAQPPIVRAAIIISFIYLAQFLGKQFDVWRAFFAALGLMLFYNPLLAASISFQLSLAAMAGILLLPPHLEKISSLPWIGKELAETLGAQIMVTPVIAYHFGAISWASPLINAFVLPLVPFLMPWGLAGLAGLIWSPLAKPFLWLCYPFLAFFVRLVNFWGRFGFIRLSLNFNLWLVVGYYLVLAGRLMRKRS